MAHNNRSIWLGGNFDGKRERLTVTSGPAELRWGGIVTHVESILEDSTQIVVIVAAAGKDPNSPSVTDVANADLAAMVVWKQRPKWLFRKQIRAVLRYPSYTQVEIDTDIAATLRRVEVFFASSRTTADQGVIPTPMLGYLLTRDF